MRDRFIRFMYGRYGVDDLSKFMLILGAVFLLISGIIGIPLLYLLAVVMMAYLYFRMFSRNIQKRYSENMKFLEYKNRVKVFFSKIHRDMKTRKTHHIYTCPNCRQRIRIPKGKGRISIRCPKCYTEFIKKS
ncbi:MAG: hypothetical protein HFI34_12350 [Lachnospiraceae bacterium]|nr:hypothetical protein [Lachnospiraceae bacterium]